MKGVEDLDTEFDKYGAHDERSENSPKEDLVLVDFFDFEIREY